MSSASVESFTRSLSAQDVPVTRTTAADAAETLTALVETPAVGTELPYDGITLPDFVHTDPSPTDLTDAKTGITPTKLAIADYGSVIVGGGEEGNEYVSLFVDTHVAVVAASEVVESMGNALEELGPQVRDGLTSAVVATGPSATADMGELVTGAHGPTSVHVVVVINR